MYVVPIGKITHRRIYLLIHSVAAWFDTPTIHKIHITKVEKGYAGSCFQAYTKLHTKTPKGFTHSCLKLSLMFLLEAVEVIVDVMLIIRLSVYVLFSVRF